MTKQMHTPSYDDEFRHPAESLTPEELETLRSAMPNGETDLTELDSPVLAGRPRDDVAEANTLKDLLEKLDEARVHFGMYRAQYGVPRDIPSGVVADALDQLRLRGIQYNIVIMRDHRNRWQLIVQF